MGRFCGCPATDSSHTMIQPAISYRGRSQMCQKTVDPQEKHKIAYRELAVVLWGQFPTEAGKALQLSSLWKQPTWLLPDHSGIWRSVVETACPLLFPHHKVQAMMLWLLLIPGLLPFLSHKQQLIIFYLWGWVCFHSLSTTARLEPDVYPIWFA